MMNALMENKDIIEMACGSNFAYVLSDNAAFLPTEYKVLQSQRSGCFIPCMKMLYNGKVQLYYMTGERKPLSAMLPTLDADSFLTIVSNLFASVIDVKGNGFLSCQNIDISFEKIYVDPATYKVSLVYLPLSKRMYEDYASFENAIRANLVKLISGVPALSSTKTMQLSVDLSDGMLTLKDVYSRMKGGKGEKPAGESALAGLRLVAMNAPSRVEIKVTKDHFVIGKKAERCDGVVSFNKMISRCHCRIDKTGAGYTITDLESANGTYVNRVRLQPNQPQSIKNGDIIRLANSDFRVSAE